MATNKDKLVEALKRKNPTKTYENDEDIYADAMAGYDNVRGRLRRYEDDDAKVMSILSQNPAAQNFLAVMFSGGDFGKAYAQLPDYGKMTDEERMSYDSERKRQISEREKDSERKKAFDENFAKSAEQIKQWSEDNGISPEDIVGVVEFVQENIFDKLNSGNIDKDFIEMLFRLKNYDNDIKASKEAGILEGRNLASAERIARRKEGDGLPQLNPGGTTKEQPKDKRSDLINSIARMNSRNDIFRN